MKPLPTNAEVRSAVESVVYREASYATLDSLRAAQHAATLEEVATEMNRRVNADPLTRYLQVLAWIQEQLREVAE